MNNYEAEVVEDIPEQFDLSRYKKNRINTSANNGSNTNAVTPYRNGANYQNNPQLMPMRQHIPPSSQHPNPNYMYPIINNFDSISVSSQPFIQYPTNTNGYSQNYHMLNQGNVPRSNGQHYVQQPPHSHHIYYPKNDYDMYANDMSTIKKRNQSISRYPSDNMQTIPNEYDEKNYARQQPLSVSSKSSESKPEGRKKNSFEDEENENPYQKKEYFLKGGDDITTGAKWTSSQENLSEKNSNNEMSKSTSKLDKIAPISSTSSSSSAVPKSSLKQTKKVGVTFDEKLEVHEVRNPHYGLEIKSEKREIRKKRKDKQKEEEIIINTKLDMKAKIQNKNMIHYYFYEKTLVYNTLVYYEEKFYRGSIIKLQDKLRNSNKADEKNKEHLLQMIEKENQNTVDIIKYVKKDFMSKLEPFCNQYQTTVDKLHTIPGMYQVIQNAANSVNFAEIINFCSHKETANSPSTLRKILGHEPKVEKFLNNFQTTSIKAPVQRKADLWLPKNVLSAIDLHVRDICYANYKNLSELIFKLCEICESDLHIIRAIYKYVLITQLEALRRIDTGKLIMSNFELGIESTNTIFGRLCSFAGIENHFVRGLWKTICQEPGEKVEAKCVWNIVNLDSGWRFMQPAFTPIKLYSRPESISYEETEFYFLSDFDALFYEFLPNDKVWLFNETAIDIKNFMTKPIITPYFRTLNLFINSLNNHPSGNLEKEPFKLVLRFPQEYSETINFKYILKPQNSLTKGHNSFFINDHINMNVYVIAELLSDKNEIVFKISSMPEIGTFNFTIYANLTEEISNAPTAITTSSSSKFSNVSLNDDAKAIISFKIICSKLTPFEIPPNRINEINIFGMNTIMHRLGLIATDFKQGILGTDREGRINLVFEMLQPLDIEAYLYSTDPSISTKCLELCLYGLDLHGAPKGTFNSLLHSQLPPIGKFLIKSHHQIRSFYQFPKGDNRDWGPKQIFYDLGLHTVGNMDPYIVNEDGKQIEIEIAMLKPVTMWYKFDYDQNGTPKAIDNFCFMNYKNTSKKDRTVSFLLRFPYRGFYHLAVMATDDVFPSKPDEIVYNYLIRVQDPSNEVESFPIILNPILWKDCCLIAPKNFRLNNYDVHFSIIVPKTNQVQVTTGERILDKLEPREIENSWVGLVTLNDSAKFIYIEAECDNKFKKLIRFKGIAFHSHN